MKSQRFRNLIRQMISEHLSYQISKDVESVYTSESLDEETEKKAHKAMSSSSVFESDCMDEQGKFRGKKVRLNSPYKGTVREYMAYIKKEGRVMRVHFDATDSK